MVPRLKALVVEDDVEFGSAVCEWLAADPTWRTPEHVLDAESAMVAVRDGDPPDLVVVDLELRRVNGLEVLRHLRTDRRFQRTAVVVIGANGDPGVNRDDFLPGEVWLSKPFHMDDLAVAIKLAISRLAYSMPDGHLTSR